MMGETLVNRGGCAAYPPARTTLCGKPVPVTPVSPTPLTCPTCARIAPIFDRIDKQAA